MSLKDIRLADRSLAQQRNVVSELNGIVRTTGEDQSALFHGEGIDLRVTVCARPLRAHADAARVAQAIRNLLQNAAKFTPRGGAVMLSLDADERGGAVVAVRDTGVGIPADAIGRVFEPLMQAEHTRDRSRGGLGLGLALVKGLVELHGGTVTAASEGPGRGALFTIWLPLERDATRS